VIEFKNEIVIDQKTNQFFNKIFLLNNKDFYFSHSYYFFFKPFMFINIPKNASSSFLLSLKNCSSFIKKNKELFWFTIIRDPLERFISTFHFLLDIGIAKSVESLGCFLYGDNNFTNNKTELLHFAPQKLYVDWFQSKYLIKFYDIKNLEILINDVKPYLEYNKNMKIFYNNKSSRKDKNVNELNIWIEENKKLVDNFLKEDIEWINSLKMQTGNITC
jgi:hypothetical protein